MSDGGLRDGDGAPNEPPAEPLPAPPQPELVTQLMPRVDQEPVASPTEVLAPVPGLLAEPEPGSALDTLFGETQFREYEPGVLDPNARPFTARAASPTAGVPHEPATRARVSRSQKVLISVTVALVALLALVALFFVGTRLPALLGPAPAVVSSTPSATPSPTSTTKPVGPIANGVHPWTALLGGECVDPFTNPWAEKFTVVDCAKPHPAQMVFRGTFVTSAADPSYPGVEKLQAQISLLCAAPGVINLAAAGAYSDAQLQGSYAVTAEQWADGEHDYFCFVNRASGQPLTASVAVPPPAPAAPSP